MVSTWKDEFQLPDHSRLPTNSPIYIYINKINNRLVFKIKKMAVS